MRCKDSSTAGFEDGRGPGAKQCEWLLEVGKAMETDSVLGMQPAGTSILTISDF